MLSTHTLIFRLSCDRFSGLSVERGLNPYYHFNLDALLGGYLDACYPGDKKIVAGDQVSSIYAQRSALLEHALDDSDMLAVVQTVYALGNSDQLFKWLWELDQRLGHEVDVP